MTHLKHYLNTLFLCTIMIFCCFLSPTEQAAASSSSLRASTYWYNRKCKITIDDTGDEINWFHVPDHAYVKCSLETCPLRSKSKYNVDRCFTCCWSKIIGKCLIKNKSIFKHFSLLFLGRDKMTYSPVCCMSRLVV